MELKASSLTVKALDVWTDHTRQSPSSKGKDHEVSIDGKDCVMNHWKTTEILWGRSLGENLKYTLNRKSGICFFMARKHKHEEGTDLMERGNSFSCAF